MSPKQKALLNIQAQSKRLPTVQFIRRSVCLPWSCTPTIWSIESIKHLRVEKQEMKKCDAVQRPTKDPKPLNSPYKQKQTNKNTAKKL